MYNRDVAECGAVEISLSTASDEVLTQVIALQDRTMISR